MSGVRRERPPRQQRGAGNACTCFASIGMVFGAIFLETMSKIQLGSKGIFKSILVSMVTSTRAPPSSGFIRTPLSKSHLTLPFFKLLASAVAPAAN